MNLKFTIELKGVHIPEDIGYDSNADVEDHISKVLEDCFSLTNVKVETVTR